MRIAGFEFSDGARFQAGAIQNANEVGTHLELLRKQFKGELTPKDVVEDARNPNSPLHSFFEWDDSAAAEQYRLKQARGLIRSVVAIYTTPKEPARRAKAFIHIPEAGAEHYRSTPDALSTKKTRELVLQRAWREFQGWRQRYKDLKEFADLFAAADEVAKKLPKVG
jgi:hypothetical protein